ncbi:Phenylalanine--tRNA ligase beta subunit [Candidatus Nasuia deltocephalinicola]|nr:Phenylalanine--tRNA ligase beta subunit [Candidatus Nasuia deltocephalinicola]
MILNFLFFNTFLNLNYKNIFFYKKIYFLGFEFYFNFYFKYFNFNIFFILLNKLYFNFLERLYIYRFLVNKKKFYFLSFYKFNNFIIFVYFISLKKIYIFFKDLIINLYYLFFFLKKKIFFYKKLFINFYNTLFYLCFKKKYLLIISCFYNKIYLSNINLLFKNFLNIFILNSFKLIFILNSFKKIFYIIFNKKIFKRFLFIIFYNLIIDYLPKYLKFILKINKLLSNNVIINIINYFKLLFGINFLIYNFFLKDFSFIIDFIFYRKYLFILNNNFFLKKNFGYYLNNNLLFFNNYYIFNNYFDIFYNNYNFIFNFILYDLNIKYNFYISCDNSFVKNNLNYFIFNKNIEYLICIFKKISSYFKKSYILDKIIDFPIKNYIFLYINKIYFLININIFHLSNILNLLNFDFIYYKYYYLVYIPYFRNDILIEEDLIDEIYKFFKINFFKKKYITFLKFNLNFKIKYKFLFIYNLKKILFYKNIKEISSFSFLRNNFFNFSLNNNFIKILNPISDKMSYMRFNLYDGLIYNFLNNYNQLKYFYIYEFGKIYYYNTNFFFKNSVRSFYEIYKISLFLWNINFNILNLDYLVYLFSDLFFFLKIDFLIKSIFYNSFFNENCFFFVLNDRLLGNILKLNFTFNNKISNFFIIDLNLKKKKNKINFNFLKKKFFNKDINIIFNFKFCFQNFIFLIKKLFFKYNIYDILYNIYYINDYKFYKFICIRIVFMVDFYLNFNYINYLIFKIINYFTINNLLWIT